MNRHGLYSAFCISLLILLSAGCATDGGGQDQVAAPTFSPQPGTYTAALNVAITTSTPGATIRFTTDGSTPTEASGTAYTAPVPIAGTLTLKALAFKSGLAASPVSSGLYTISTVVSAPVFSPGPGTYASARDVAIVTTTAGASIRYTVDGSTPSETVGTLYAGPVHVAESLTLRAVAYLAGLTTSPVTSGEYTITPQVAAPAFDPAPGTYPDPVDVTISTATPGASIRYTTDGSTPTPTFGTIYAAPVRVAETRTLKAVAYLTGWTTSPVTSGEYKIGLFVEAPAFSPVPGTYAEPQDIVMTTVTPAAAIRYTTDGSTPTETAGTVYTASVRLTGSTVLKAVAYRTGWTTSDVTTGAYTIGQTVAAPTFSVPPGMYASAKEVAITTITGGASIRYTTDGSTPTATVGTLYAGPVRVIGSLTLKAVAFRAGWTTSPVATGVYERVSISAGAFHTITARSDGSVWTWGQNQNGQLGDNSTNQSSVPVQLAGLSGIAEVAAGYYHSVALKSDGTVWAWGLNLFGQLGDNTTNQRLVPVQVLGITGVTALAAGEYSTYALRADGTVWAWGQNLFGQLGDNTMNQRLTPVEVQGLTDVAAIAAGESHAVALKKDGTVWAWGNNVSGALGNGTTNSSSVPVQITSLSGIVGIAANGHHSAAVKSDGMLWTWGSGLFGELGHGANPQFLPAPVQAIGVAGAAAAGAGSFHTLVLLDDGTLSAFGNNAYGQLGDGTNANRSLAVPVAAISSAIAVAGGLGHTVAIVEGGAVQAWGWNQNGQLGDGTTNDRWTPTLIMP